VGLVLRDPEADAGGPELFGLVLVVHRDDHLAHGFDHDGLLLLLLWLVEPNHQRAGTPDGSWVALA